MNRGQAFLLVILTVVTALLLVIVAPFIEYILLALILGYVLFPLHLRLSHRVGEFLSPLILLTGSVVVVVLPVIYVGMRFVRDLRTVARGESNLQTEVIEAQLAALTGAEIGFVELLELLGEMLIDMLFGGGSVAFVSSILHASIGISLVLFLVFYLLRDGRAFITWVQDAIPLPLEVSTRFIDQINRTVWGSVIGHGFAALVQTLIAGFGLYIVGIPNVFFWTFVMFVLAFLPLIGVFLVWGPAAVYLYLIGNTIEGVFLAVYGGTLVSLIDYYVRPIVIDRRARLNPGVILVGVFGGVYTMGFIGLFIGPIAIGVFVATLRTIRDDYDSL